MAKAFEGLPKNAKLMFTVCHAYLAGVLSRYQFPAEKKAELEEFEADVIQAWTKLKESG